MYQIHVLGPSFSKYVSWDCYDEDQANNKCNLGDYLKMSFDLSPSNVTQLIAF